MAVHILIAFAIAAAWIGSLYVKPFGKCWRCGGKGNLHRKGSRRAPVCPRCKGRKRGQRPRLAAPSTAPSAWCAPSWRAPAKEARP